MTSTSRAARRVPSRTAAIRIAAVVLASGLLYGWAVSVLHSPDPSHAIATDWRNFRRAGACLLEGRIAEIYGPSFETSLPFPYPPYFLYVCAPLGAIESTWIAYASCVALATAALASALFVLRRALPAERGRHTTAAFVAFASAPWIGAIVTGQQSALFVLFVACAMRAWNEQKPGRAGLWLALLCLKPNLALVLPLLALASRQWRLLLGFLLGLALLIASTLSLGVAIWREYFDASRRMAELLAGGAIPIWKQQTLYAFWRWVFGGGARFHLAEIAALACALAFALPLLRAWRRLARSGDRPRLFAVAVLYLVACNPYLFFYDGLLLLIPAVVWYTGPQRYARPSAHRAVGVCLALAYAWQHASEFVLQQRGPPLLGPIVAVWLAIELLDLARCPAASARDLVPAPLAPRMPTRALDG